MHDGPAFEQLQAENQRLCAEIAARDEQHAEAQIPWFNHVNDAIFVADTQWQIQQWNQAAEQLYGWASADAVGKPIWDVIPIVRYLDGESDASATQTLVQRGSWRGTFVQRTRDDRELVIDGSTRAIIDAQNAITGYIGINRDISVHIQAEQELRDQARVLEQTQVMVFDLEQRITFWSHGAERLYGYSKAEALGQVVYKLLQTKFPLSLDQIRAALERDGHWSGTLIHTRRDGYPTTVASLWVLDRTSDGQPWRIIESVTDISVQMQVKQELREQARVLDQAHVLVRDSDDRITLWTHGAEQLYGYTKPEALGQISHSLLQTQFPEPLDQIMDTLRASGHWSGTLAHCTRVGQVVRVASDWILDRDPGGQSYRVIEANTDITELVRANTRLQLLTEASQAFAEVEADYQSVLNVVAQRVVEALGDFCLIRMLADDQSLLQAAALYYYDPSDAEALSFIQNLLAGAPLRADEPSIDARVFKSGQPMLVPVIDLAQLEARIKPEYRAGIERFRPHSMIVVPLKLQNRTIGLLGLYRSRPHWPAFTEDDLRLAQDLAGRAALALNNARLLDNLQQELGQRKRAEQALVAEHARVVQLKDEFMATMSHELRTPLAGVLGYTELLLDQVYGVLSDRQTRAVERIDENGRNLLALIGDILDYTKFEAGKTVLDIGLAAVPALCAASVELVRASAQAKQIGLTSTLDSRVVVIDADARRLQQMLVNLLSNAIKFTPEGGRVGLEVRADPERGQAIFTVWDTGIGIAEGDLGKLFQPFTQLDSRLSREYEGTGLGLALVRRIAEAHGGSVGVESTLGEGSRFSLLLPWQPSPSPKAPSEILTSQVRSATPTPMPESVVPPPAGALPGILLVEDNRGNVLLTHEILSLHGYPVQVARTATDGLALAREQQPALVLMDIQLPGMSGLQAIERMRADAELRNIPVIALTALVLPGDRERCLQAGANAYLPKPVGAHTLVATIEQVLGERK